MYNRESKQNLLTIDLDISQIPLTALTFVEKKALLASENFYGLIQSYLKVNFK